MGLVYPQTINAGGPALKSSKIKNKKPNGAEMMLTYNSLCLYSYVTEKAILAHLTVTLHAWFTLINSTVAIACHNDYLQIR